MPRPEIHINPEDLFDMSSKGMNQQELAAEFGVSTQTISKRMAEISAKQGVLMKYREIQTLQLTELQYHILEAITPEKISEAPLSDLVRAFKILKDKEQVMEGKPSEIQGLVAYLVELDKQEAQNDQPIDVQFSEVKEQKSEPEIRDPEDPNWMPEI